MIVGGLHLVTLDHRAMLERILVVHTIVPPPLDEGVTQGMKLLRW